MILFCLIQVRDEERFLPGFLHHMAPHVDGIVALDDCSSDRTLEILQAEPKVVSILRERRAGPPHAHEASNRHRLILEAARLGAEWVICGDADERYEERFLRRLRREAASGEREGRPVRLVRIINLWDSPRHYRVDGRCAPRWSARLFRVPSSVTLRQEGLHRPWFPPELDRAPRALMPVNCYHLKMIARKDREGRFRKFTSIDPDRRQQAIGYDHLVDETGLKLRRIPPWRRYRDLPPGRPLPVAASAPAVSGCRADPAFSQRFHLDPASRPRRLVAPPAVPVGPWQMPAPTEWPSLHGFDFAALFDAARFRP